MSQRESIQQQITELLEAKDPAKAPKVNVLLERYAGHEEALLAALKRKYNCEDIAEAPAAVSSPPSGGAATVDKPAATSVETPGSDDGLEPYRQRLRRLYVAHCPARVPFVDHDLKKYPGREEDVLRAASARFGVEPPAPEAQPQKLDACTPEHAPSGDDRPTTSTDVARPDSYLARLTRIYQRYAPERVHQAPRHLEKYAGHEEEVIRAAVRHFGPEPTSPQESAIAAPAPPAAALHHSDDSDGKTTDAAPPTTFAPSPPVVTTETSSDRVAPRPLVTEPPRPQTDEHPPVQPCGVDHEESGAASLPDGGRNGEAPLAVTDSDVEPREHPVHAEAPPSVRTDPTGTPASEAEEHTGTLPTNVHADNAQGSSHSAVAPPEEDRPFLFVPTPQPVVDSQETQGTTFVITPMPESSAAVSGAASPETHEATESPPVARDSAIAHSPPTSPTRHSTPASNSPACATQDMSAGPDEADATLVPTVKALFSALSATSTLDGELCTYLISVATQQPPSPQWPSTAVTESEFLAALDEVLTETDTAVDIAATRLRRLVSRLGSRGRTASLKEVVSASKPRCFWCHWCVLPSVEDRWQRAWATLVPAKRLLRICFPHSTRVELPIAFGHVLTCRRDVFTTRSAAPHRFAAHGVRLTFSSDAVPLEVLLCLERVEDAQAIVSAYRAYEATVRQHTKAQRQLTDHSSASLSSQSRSLVQRSALATSTSAAESMRVWWCREGDSTMAACEWSLSEDGASVHVCACEEVAGAPATSFPAPQTVMTVVEECDCPVTPPGDRVTPPPCGFALVLRDYSFVYCCTCSPSQRRRAVQWMTRCVARQELLQVPFSQW